MKKLFFILIIFLFLFISSPSVSAYCFKEAGNTYGISPDLLWSIAKLESNFNPMALNVNRNGTYDFGVMQINSSWKIKLGDTRWQHLSNPCFNVMVGAWILSNCIREYGYTWDAVGCYNANSKFKRTKYARKIYNILKTYNLIGSQKATN